MKDKKWRGKLIRIIIETCISNNLFKSTEELEKALKKELDNTLKFEVNINELETEGGKTSGLIEYEIKKDDIKTLRFSVIGKKVIY